MKEANLRLGRVHRRVQLSSLPGGDRRPELRRRLLLVLFALGTNMGIKQIASGNHGHGETEAALRHVRRLYLNGTTSARAIVRVANATFAERDRDLWGEGTASASDSKKFGAWDANLMTEWHNRYRARRHGLLARRATPGMHLQPAQGLFLVGSGRHDRRRPPPLHQRRD